MKIKAPNKKAIMFLIVATCLVAGAFAQSSSTDATSKALTNLSKVFSTVYQFFASSYTLVICTVGLIWTGIKWITNRGEPTILKDLGPKVGAFILIGGASGFCQLFFTPEKETNKATSGETFSGLF